MSCYSVNVYSRLTMKSQGLMGAPDATLLLRAIILFRLLNRWNMRWLKYLRNQPVQKRCIICWIGQYSISDKPISVVLHYYSANLFVLVRNFSVHYQGSCQGLLVLYLSHLLEHRRYGYYFSYRVLLMNALFLSTL